MDFLEIKEKFSIQEETVTFQTLIENSPDLAEELKDKNVVILPSHDTKDAFYAGSLDTLDYLNNSELNADISSTDENYKELGLHSADIWLGTFIVKNFVIPIFCSVIAAYIYENLKAKPDDKISLRFIIEKKDGNTASVNFDGKVENLNKALDAVKEFGDEN